MQKEESPLEIMSKLKDGVEKGHIAKFIVVALHDDGMGAFNISTIDSKNMNLIELLALTGFVQVTTNAMLQKTLNPPNAKPHLVVK